MIIYLSIYLTNFNQWLASTSGGVGTFGDRLSAGEDFEDGEERSSERRELGELVSDLFTALLNFATLGVEGDDFPGVVSDTLVLFR